MNVRFCPACRSLILVDFRFCPYCGTAVKGPGLSEALGEPFAKMSAGLAGEPASDAPRGDQTGEGPGTSIFADAEKSLQRLETDMELILEELEKEGRNT
jgi:hypothetical protein